MAAANRPNPDGTAIFLAGGVTAAAWIGLAWLSHTSARPLGWMLATMVVAWSALAWAMARTLAGRTRLIAGFAVLFRLIALGGAPVMEDDHHRFMWDGYRLAATGNPYAEPPLASFADETVSPEFRRVLDRINHPDVPTVYGPLTQWAFRGSHLVAPARIWPWKLLLFAVDLAWVFLLWPSLRWRGRLLLAWCPLAVFETGFNAHPDALALALVVTAWWLGKKSRPMAAGAAAGLAITAKVFALLVVPYVLWRQGRRAWAMAAVLVILLYAPFWVRGSAADLAGLRAMAGGWEFNSSAFALVATLASPDLARVVGGFTFGLIWLVLLARWARVPARLRVLPPGEWVYGAFLLLSGTANPWYCLWLLPFVAARPSVTGFCALAAVSLTYVTGLNLGDPALENFNHPVWLRPVEFGLIGLGALWDWRRRKTRS